MHRIKGFVSLAFLVLYLVLKSEAAATGDGTNGTATPTYFSVRIGAVLESNSSMGAMVDLCISMAQSDFYDLHPDYRTRLVLSRKYVQDELDVASAVLELIKNEEVHSILGPQTWTEDKFTVELGRKAHVPVISFTERGSFHSYKQSPYFIRTAPDDSNQAKALASLCQRFEWNTTILLYEDTDDGVQFLSKLNKAFQESNIRLAHVVAISTSAEDHRVMKELKDLMAMQTRVFVVHMNAVLGSRLFLLAKEAGMMSEGYAWLITDRLGNFVNSMDSAAIASMEGVLGLRTYVPKSENLSSFRTRWGNNMLLKETESSGRELNVYGFWAYDTIWALAMAIEKIGPVIPGFLETENSRNGSDIFNLRISQFGQELLRELQDITFEGLTGEFHIVDGKLNSSSLELLNVLETRCNLIGYWTPDLGTTLTVKNIFWPGDLFDQPKGFAIQKLKVGVPKKYGFTEFVNVSTDPETNKPKVTGFSIDVFKAALARLNISVSDCDFIPFVNESGQSNGTYNDLLHNVGKAYDIVVGDATILADRAKYVDFTLPFSESGTVMVVKDKQKKDMWSFVKPFKWDLWLTIISTCTFIGIVLRILEHRTNNDSDSIRRQKEQLGFLFWFPIAVLAFPERNMVASRWSRFVLVLWMFMAYIIMQSYTANLSAMLTVDQLNFRLSDDYNIGCQKDSFVVDFLKDRLHVSESKIKEYSTIEEYHDAMNKGSKNGGIDAIFDEIPYMKLFLDRYDSDYKIVGPTYRTDGFGFAFPLESPLVVQFSRAILDVTEDGIMTEIELKDLGSKYSSYNQSDPTNKQKLTVFDFGGLFIITASGLIFALFCSETSVGRRFADIVAQYSHRCYFFLSFRGNESAVKSTVDPDGNGDSSGEEEQVSDDDSDQLNSDASSSSGMAPESDPGNINILARDGQANESDQSNIIREVELSEQRNTDVSARQISS